MEKDIIIAIITILGNVVTLWFDQIIRGGNLPSIGQQFFNGLYRVIIAGCLCYFTFLSVDIITTEIPSPLEWTVIFWLLMIISVYRLYHWKNNAWYEWIILIAGLVKVGITFISL